MSGSEGVVASGVSRLGPKEELLLRQWFEPRARPVTSPQSDEPALSGFDGTSASLLVPPSVAVPGATGARTDMVVRWTAEGAWSFGVWYGVLSVGVVVELRKTVYCVLTNAVRFRTVITTYLSVSKYKTKACCKH